MRMKRKSEENRRVGDKEKFENVGKKTSLSFGVVKVFSVFFKALSKFWNFYEV